MQFRRDLAEGAYDIAWWKAAPRQRAEIAEQYTGLGIGLADASLVALAHRLNTNEIATFDEWHFRAIRPSIGSAYRLVPRDL